MERMIIIIQHGTDDISAWTVELPTELFAQYVAEGRSVRGTITEVLSDIANDLHK